MNNWKETLGAARADNLAAKAERNHECDCHRGRVNILKHTAAPAGGAESGQGLQTALRGIIKQGGQMPNTKTKVEKRKDAKVAVLVRVEQDDLDYMKGETLAATNAAAVDIYVRKHIQAERGTK